MQTSLLGCWVDRLGITSIPKSMLLWAVCTVKVHQNHFSKFRPSSESVTLLTCLPGFKCLPLRRNLKASRFSCFREMLKGVQKLCLVWILLLFDSLSFFFVITLFCMGENYFKLNNCLVKFLLIFHLFSLILDLS